LEHLLAERAQEDAEKQKTDAKKDQSSKIKARMEMKKAEHIAALEKEKAEFKAKAKTIAEGFEPIFGQMNSMNTVCAIKAAKELLWLTQLRSLFCRLSKPAKTPSLPHDFRYSINRL